MCHPYSAHALCGALLACGCIYACLNMVRPPSWALPPQAAYDMINIIFKLKNPLTSLYYGDLSNPIMSVYQVFPCRTSKDKTTQYVQNNLFVPIGRGGAQNYFLAGPRFLLAFWPIKYIPTVFFGFRSENPPASAIWNLYRKCNFSKYR